MLRRCGGIDGDTIVFTHEQFILGLSLHVQMPRASAAERMRSLRSLRAAVHVPNRAVVRVRIEAGSAVELELPRP